MPTSTVVIEDFGVAQDALYFRVLDGGVQKMRRLDFNGDRVTDLAKAPVGGIRSFATSPQVPGVLYPVQTWISPQRWFKFDPVTARGQRHRAHSNLEPGNGRLPGE